MPRLHRQMAVPWDANARNSRSRPFLYPEYLLVGLETGGALLCFCIVTLLFLCGGTSDPPPVITRKRRALCRRVVLLASTASSAIERILSIVRRHGYPLFRCRQCLPRELGLKFLQTKKIFPASDQTVSDFKNSDHVDRNAAAAMKAENVFAVGEDDIAVCGDGF
jgi:hypothetical protein